MRIDGKEYRTIWYENNVVKIINQTKLPHKFTIKELKTVKDAVHAIKIMEVRGAPLIGATASYGIVLAIIENNNQSFLKKSAENLIKYFGNVIYMQQKTPVFIGVLNIFNFKAMSFELTFLYF